MDSGKQWWPRKTGARSEFLQCTITLTARERLACFSCGVRPEIHLALTAFIYVKATAGIAMAAVDNFHP